MMTLLSLHSWWRWVVLVVAIVAIIKAILGWTGKQPWTDLDTRLSGFYPTAFIIQFLLGLILYASALAGNHPLISYSTGNGILRVSTEHFLMMFIALAIASVARGRMKRADDALVKHRNIAIGFIISLLLVLVAIPARAWGFYWYG